MKTFNALRYAGSNHTTLVVDPKHNADLAQTFHATALSEEEAQAQLLEQLSDPEEGAPELNITDVPSSKFSKLTTPQLLKLYEKTEQMIGAHEMIEAILIKRGAVQIPETVEGEDPEPEEETPSKPAREYKKCMTEECLQARLAEARTNYKKFAKFLCTKTKTEEYGIIRSARLDKRSGFIQYRIEIVTKPTEDSPIYTERSGRIFGKGDDSKDLTIFDSKPEFIQLADPAPKAENNTEVVNS